MTRLPKKFPPNEKALPKLLDPECETKRLESIKARRVEIRQLNEKCDRARKTFDKICKGEIE